MLTDISAMMILQNFLLILTVTACNLHSPCAQTETTPLPVGHLLPFGGHRAPDVPIDEVDINSIPDPYTFWEKYVQQAKPLIFRGGSSQYPGFTKWTEDYLRSQYSDLELRLEGKSERGSGIPVGAKGLGRDTMDNFLNHYKRTDAYIVSELPVPMYKDIYVLPSLACGSFWDRVVEVDLWMSSGQTKSILHKDAFNQINCLLNGTKYWKTVEYKYEKFLHKTWEPEREIGGNSQINVSSVDLIKYPNISKVRWSEFTLEGGDCLFLPGSYYHQVNSVGCPNVAVSMLFSRLKEFDDTGCQGQYYEFRSMSDLDVLWQWSGYGVMSMGNSDAWSLRDNYVKYAEQHGVFTAKDLQQQMILLLPEKDQKEILNYANNAWRVLDPNGTGKLTVAELMSLDLQTLREHVLLLDLLEPSNSEIFEYYYFDEAEIRNVLFMLVGEETVLKRSSFIDYYTGDKFGGSLKYANEIFDKLKPANPEYATRKEVSENVDSALYNFRIHALLDTTEEEDTSGESIIWREDDDSRDQKEENVKNEL